jgi:hypothetical protein
MEEVFSSKESSQTQNVANCDVDIEEFCVDRLFKRKKERHILYGLLIQPH